MLAKEGNTGTYRAVSVLDTLSVAYNYGRSATQDQFKLQGASAESLDNFDAAFKRFLLNRMNTEVERAEEELANCKRCVGK